MGGWNPHDTSAQEHAANKTWRRGLLVTLGFSVSFARIRRLLVVSYELQLKHF